MSANTVWASRRIILPFDLRQTPFTVEHRHVIFELFPDLITLENDHHFLLLRMSKLPPKPWPQTLAGWPLYFTTDPNDHGNFSPITRRGSPRIRLLRELDWSDTSANDNILFTFFKEFFLEMNVPITEIQLWGNFVAIVLERGDTKLETLPWSIARTPCFYLFDSEMDRPTNTPGFQPVEPTNTAYDTTAYPILQPREITHTDLPLLQLHKNESFKIGLSQSSHPFETNPPRRGDFLPASRIRAGSDVFMDSPSTGYGLGTASVNSQTRFRIPFNDPLQLKFLWIQTRWDYMGQGSHLTNIDGACGSVMWNTDGRVVGFFRYAPKNGHFVDWCQSIACDYLIEHGLTVVEDLE